MPEKYPSPEDWATGRRLAAETRIIASTRRRSATITGGGESGTQVVRVRDRARRVALTSSTAVPA